MTTMTMTMMTTTMTTTTMTTTTTMLLDLPEDVWQHIALNLCPPDILNFLSTHRRIHKSLGESTIFWNMLLARDNNNNNNNDTASSSSSSSSSYNMMMMPFVNDDCPSSARRAFMIQAYKDSLPFVKWYPIRQQHQGQQLAQRHSSYSSSLSSCGVSAREGHLACVFHPYYQRNGNINSNNSNINNNKNKNKKESSKICITGGFTDDNSIYILNVPKSLTLSQRQYNANPASWTWNRLRPKGHQASFVYGATLTTLEGEGYAATATATATTTTDSSPSSSSSNFYCMRAIRFGGFKAGGYSQETNEVAVLTIKEKIQDDNEDDDDEMREQNYYNNYNCNGNNTNNREDNLIASWETIPTENSQFAKPRAYHSATLLNGRYLLIIGGMTWQGSIMKEAILDTQTWKWLDVSIVTTTTTATSNSSNSNDTSPSGRHGHSVILDSKRNRIVLFGGGSGTDLLRSGKDNSEVWELKFGHGWKENLEKSLPWTWRKIYSDSTTNDNNNNNNNNNTMTDNAQQQQQQQQQYHTLSPAEALCLGRCHNSVKVSPDKVILLFGSGRPSTNRLISYDLRTDTFLRPKVEGPLPNPRFTGIVAFLPEEGYLFAHGGYSAQESDAIDDMTVLDLAPALQRDFTGLPVNGNARCFGPVTDEHALNGRQDRDATFRQMFFHLSNADQGERQAMASQMLNQMMASGQLGGRAFMLMNMIANGAAIFQNNDNDSGDDDEEEEDDDGNYIDHDDDDDDYDHYVD